MPRDMPLPSHMQGRYHTFSRKPAPRKRGVEVIQGYIEKQRARQETALALCSTSKVHIPNRDGASTGRVPNEVRGVSFVVGCSSGE